ncbi:MAG: DUF1559 domain-containing protein [Planctomycetia bacterium]|nr:DUF1559 domain-containing protein [Planctomycetia bacterium]
MRLLRTASCFALILMAAAGTRAQEFDPARLAAAVAPFVDAQTVVVAHVDLRSFDAASVVPRIAEVMRLSDADRQWAHKDLLEGIKRLKDAGARDVFALVNVADVPKAPVVIVVPLGPDANADAIAEGLRPGSDQPAVRLNNAIVAGFAPAIERTKSMRPAARPEIAAAFQAAGNGAAQLLFVPSTDARRAVEETLPSLPAEVGGGPTKAFTQGIVWAAASAQLPPKKLSLRVVIQSANAEAARAFEHELSALFAALGREPSVRELVPKFDELAKLLAPKVSGDRLTVDLNEENGGAAALGSLLLPPVQAAQTASRRARSTNNLKQLGLAMHNYLSSQRTFPPRSSYAADGKPLLSWRVHLLPYLESGDAGATLYKEFKLDEPWDSEHNRKLIERMPAVYRSPLSSAAAGKTTYVAPVYPAAIFGAKEPLQIKQVTDGLSNTIMLVEADDDHAVVWTKPDDIQIDAANPAKGLVNGRTHGLLVLIADGSVRFIGERIGQRALKALLTADQGEVLDAKDVP